MLAVYGRFDPKMQTVCVARRARVRLSFTKCQSHVPILVIFGTLFQIQHCFDILETYYIRWLCMQTGIFEKVAGIPSKVNLQFDLLDRKNSVGCKQSKFQFCVAQKLKDP